MKDVRFIRLIMSEISFRLIITVINGYECNLLKPKALSRRARGKNRTKSSSLLLNLAKLTEPGGEVVSAKCGATSEGVNLKQAFIRLRHSA